MGLEIPKQLVKIAGKPIMQHTLQVFQSAPQIDEIVVAMTPGFTAEAEAIVASAGCTKVSRVIEGGATRTETTMRAIEAVGATSPEANVLFHDAVRPFIDHRVIDDCVRALERYEAVDVAIPSADTIIRVDDYGGTVIKDVPRRDLLRRGQTPQCFRLSTIREAYRLALADPDFTGGKVTATDDCSIVLRYLPDVPIVVVPGSEHNMKVTHPVDVFLADKLFQLSSQAPPPSPEDHSGYESRLTGKTVVIFGGSQGIGADIAELTRSFGARVYSFSRSETGTHVENSQDIENALAKAYGETGRIDYVVNTAGVLHTGRGRRRNHRRVAADQLPRPAAGRAGGHRLPPPDQGPAAALHLQQLHAGPRRLQPLLLGQGGHRQPDPGSGRRVGGRRSARQLHQPRADRHAHADARVRAGAARHPALIPRRGDDLDRRAHLRADRPHRRHPPPRPDGGRPMTERSEGTENVCLWSPPLILGSPRKRGARGAFPRGGAKEGS
jgi:2-C-methyl-D-erythritol 4-phosphate cytidylyltransferase